MIRRRSLSIVVGLMCIGWAASAADLPSMPHPKKAQAQTLQQKPKIKLQKTAAKRAITKPVKTAKISDLAMVPDEPAVSDRKEVDLSWVLGPLVATADGPRKEGSASVEGNLIVVEPGYVTSPYMIIELSGHVVKTAGSTARIDIKVAGKSRKVVWDLDAVESGAFTIKLNETLSEGSLPAYFHVSALAFATKTKRGSVAMVSLEKVRIRVGETQLSVK